MFSDVAGVDLFSPPKEPEPEIVEEEVVEEPMSIKERYYNLPIVTPKYEISDVSKLYNVIMSLPNLNDEIKRSILYALEYFINKDDEIPDEIPELGYLDDRVIVRYVVDQIMKDNSELFQA